MTTKWLLCAAATCLLGACESTTSSSQMTSRNQADELRSEVQIIDDTTYTATWHNRPSTIVRLAFDSAIPVSDAQAIETAAMITGCTPLGNSVEPMLVGGLTSVRIPMDCASRPS